jgi:mono/diheme cytochrome c family protein
MPAFDGVLSEQEIDDILSYIKSTWTQRERDYQQKMTDQSSVDPAASGAN